MKIIKGATAQHAVNGFNGIIDAIALNDVWERYHGPGFGHALFKIATRPDGHDVSFGADDAIQSVMHLGEILAGVGIRNKTLLYRGIGGEIGVWLVKLMELTNKEVPRYIQEKQMEALR